MPPLVATGVASCRKFEKRTDNCHLVNRASWHNSESWRNSVYLPFSEDNPSGNLPVSTHFFRDRKALNKLTPKKKNIIGPKIQRYRRSLDLDQDELAARLTRLGWDCSENIVSKIEAGYRRVIDEEIALIARALGVQPGDLFPT